MSDGRAYSEGLSGYILGMLKDNKKVAISQHAGHPPPPCFCHEYEYDLSDLSNLNS